MPLGIKQTRCKGCDAPIFFARTSGGHLSPYNVDGPEGPWRLTGDVVDGAPRIVYDPRVEGDYADPTGYQTHYATCPHSQDFRQPQAQLSLVPDP